MLAVLVAVSYLGSGAALANTYTGLLDGSPSLTNLNVFGTQEGPGFVYGSDSWTAPSGLSFGGFAYTSASFYSSMAETEGGISVGFGGDGTANQPDLLFPWTWDCAISNDTHNWAHNGGAGPVAGLNNPCETSGSTGGWNYDNSELQNFGGNGDPQRTYQTLWFTEFCQAASCSTGDFAYGSVTDLSAQLIDPDNAPSGGADWASSVNNSAWYQTDHDAPTLNVEASDPAGVCTMQAWLNGPNSYSSGNIGNATPAVTNVGGAIGEEFQFGLNPCWTGSTDTGSWTLPANLADGSYSVSVQASNPGNYQGQGFSSSGQPTVASGVDQIQIDDTTPSITWESSSSQYTSATSEEFQLHVGPSGIGSVVCTDNGAPVAATLVPGSMNGQSSVWSVPTTASGTNQVSCTAANNDINGELTGGSTQTFNVDSTVPTVTFIDANYRTGVWTRSAQTFTVGATTGPSGLQSIKCAVDGGADAVLVGLRQVTVSGNGEHTLSCTATSNSGVQGTATYHVWIDSEQPTVSVLVDGTSPTNSWFSGTPTVQVIGSEQGGLLSGLSQIVCTVTTGGQPDPGSPFTLSAANGRLENNTGSFTLTTNGTDLVSCVGTTNAGTVQTTPSTVKVNVDDPLISPQGTGTTVYGSSAQIDGGQDPYSDGPSESTWYHTAQPVTITANASPGGAPISSIGCKGALDGTWQNAGPDTDQAGGEQITVYVQPPGGELSCTASDTAGNTFSLGTYLFQIDDTAPTGHFVTQGSWPLANEVEVYATDNGGSGVANVYLYATNSAIDDGAPQDLGQMTYDPATGYYEALVPDGIAPFTSGTWTFTVNTSDVAGNTGQITAGPDGGTEQLTLPLLQDTQITATAGSVTATPEAAIPVAAAQQAGIDSDALARQDLAPQTVTSTRVRVNRHRRHRAGAGSRRRVRAPRTSVSRQRRLRGRTRTTSKHRTPGVITVPYGKPLNLRGALTNLKTGGAPVPGATVLIYEQVTGSTTFSLLGSTNTNPQGHYAYQVPAGASRSIYVIYPGSEQLRPAGSDLQERSIGQVAMHVSQIRAGGRLIIKGRVRGGHIPAGGVNVTIDYREAGAPGTGTLGTVRTNARGAYRFTQPFALDTRGLTYIVWAVVQAEPGWPFLAARSATYARPVR